mmetsp:Transcript_26041/g.55711  ORF Transcript_26041/g.55711 Transcript_26041/m.55711 type:complete len:92 (-) Transcript_26041:51-326(-)
MWLVFTVGSYFWAGILYLVVEAPFGNLQKLGLGLLRPGTPPSGQVKRKKTDLQSLREFESPRKNLSIGTLTPRKIELQDASNLAPSQAAQV